MERILIVCLTLALGGCATPLQIGVDGSAAPECTRMELSGDTAIISDCGTRRELQSCAPGERTRISHAGAFDTVRCRADTDLDVAQR